MSAEVREDGVIRTVKFSNGSLRALNFEVYPNGGMLVVDPRNGDNVLLVIEPADLSVLLTTIHERVASLDNT